MAERKAKVNCEKFCSGKFIELAYFLPETSLSNKGHVHSESIVKIQRYFQISMPGISVLCTEFQ